MFLKKKIKNINIGMQGKFTYIQRSIEMLLIIKII